MNWAGTQLQGFETNIEQLSVKTVLDEVLTSFAATLKQKNIHIDCLINENDRVMADKNLLALVVRNLISNALKFSYVGTTIQVGFENLASEWRIIIADEGMGMSEEIMHQINQETANTLASTYGTNKEKGTGLGIMLCKSFLLMMSGKLSVKKNHPKGTIFLIHLPK